jgi:uncharacterized protein YcgI (DUF1989 family)
MAGLFDFFVLQSHDTSAGCCSCESHAVRFGEETRYQHARRDNFVLEPFKSGMCLD